MFSYSNINNYKSLLLVTSLCLKVPPPSPHHHIHRHAAASSRVGHFHRIHHPSSTWNDTASCAPSNAVFDNFENSRTPVGIRYTYGFHQRYLNRMDWNTWSQMHRLWCPSRCLLPLTLHIIRRRSYPASYPYLSYCPVSDLDTSTGYQQRSDRTDTSCTLGCDQCF